FIGAKRSGVDLQLIYDSVERVRRRNSYRCRSGQFVEIAADLEQAPRGLTCFGVHFTCCEMPRDQQAAGFLPVDVEGKAPLGIETRGHMGPFHEWDLRGRHALPPLIIDENAQSDMPGGVQSEEISVLLFDDGTPIPWIGLRCNPGLEGQSFVDFGQMGLAGNARSESVELDAFTMDA